MRALPATVILGSTLLVACAQHRVKGTLAELHEVPPDLQEAKVEQGLDKAMQSYRRYLDETPRSELTPEAMRRLADLKIEKEFGVRGDGKLIEMAAPEEADPATVAPATQRPGTGIAGLQESDGDFEKRATQTHEIAAAAPALAAPAGAGATPPSGPLEALELYDRLLTEYPDFEHNDQVLYQKARALDELGRTEEAMETMERLVSTRAYSAH